MTSTPRARKPAAARPSRAAANPAGPLRLNAADAITPAAARVLTILAWVLAAALAAALLVMIAGHPIGDYMAETDFYGAYYEGARMIQRGHIDPSRYGVIGPVYEILLALFGFVARDLFLAAKLLAFAGTLATLLLWFHLLRRLAGARVALAAAAFMATNAFFFRYGYGALTDAPAIALQAGALFVLLAGVKRDPLAPGAAPRARAFALAGVLAALAFLTRYNAVYLLPAGLIAILAGGAGAPRRGRAAIAFAGGFLLPVVPWVLYSLAHGGTFSFQLHHNIAYEVFARSRGIAWDNYQRDLQPQFKTLGDVIARDPGAVASRMLINVGDHLRLDAIKLLGLPVAATAVAGLLIGLRDGTLRAVWPLLVAAALLFGTLVPVFHSERYSLALLPAYATLAGIAFGSPRIALVLGGRVWLKLLLLVIPLGAALAANQKHQARVKDQLPTEVLECAETLRQLKRPGDQVIARKWHIAYHAEVEGVGFPFAKGLPELAAYALEAKARWLFFSWPEAETRPQFFHLLDTTAVVPGLVPRRVTRPHPAVLYEIGPEFGRAPGWMANDTLRALHEVRGRLMVDGGNAKLYYRLGGIHWTRGEYRAARGALETAARLSPGDVEVWLLLGEVQLLDGDRDRARQSYERAAAIAPGNVDARVGLGWTRIAAGDFAEAGKLWRPVITSTSNPHTLLRMEALFRMLGDAEGERLAQETRARVGAGR